MRLKKLKWGLLVANSIKIFYDDSDENENLLLLKKIEFKEENSDGMKFVEVFCKENIFTQLESYTKSNFRRK